jgi:hypothetical protein
MASDNGTNSKKICEFPGCGQVVLAKGLCWYHYRQRRNGDVLTPKYVDVRKKGTPPRVTYDEAPCPNPNLPGPCHIWSKAKTRDGYGRVAFNGKMVRVHRYVWELKHGVIPAGMMLDHQCRNRACCNVDHLRCVDAKTNATENVVGHASQIEAARTHCPYGHAYTPANTYMDGRSRRCRECNRLRCAARKAKLKTEKRKAREVCVVL